MPHGGKGDLVLGAAIDEFEHPSRQSAARHLAQIRDVVRAERGVSHDLLLLVPWAGDLKRTPQFST